MAFSVPGIDGTISSYKLPVVVQRFFVLGQMCGAVDAEAGVGDRMRIAVCVM